MSAFENAARFLIEEAFSNIRMSFLGYPTIRRQTWQKICCYRNVETNELFETTTEPQNLGWSYERPERFELIAEYVEVL